ncbi:MAG TPA: hypothetical protein VD838_17500 [Anaeromyxobacteraceae bacterium]|nr:hypothetical protein [Anaeromyxobacteraceae bacterium]
MPPYAQDAFTAAHEALQAGWLDRLMTALSAAFEPWILALVALALFSWLERDVPSVLRSFLPFVVALGLAIAGGALAGRVGFGGQALATAVFASYAIATYGRRALPLLLVPLLGGLVRVHAGAHWAFDVLRGWGFGAALGVAAHLVAVRAWSRARREP